MNRTVRITRGPDNVRATATAIAAACNADARTIALNAETVNGAHSNRGAAWTSRDLKIDRKPNRVR